MSNDLADKFKAVADVLNFTDKKSERIHHKQPIVINRLDTINKPEPSFNDKIRTQRAPVAKNTKV